MNVEIYADETGTHDVTGKLGGSAVAGIAGYLGWPDDWAELSVEWQKVLDEYRIKEFHYGEFVRRKERTTKPEWPYYGWTDERANKFEHKLAALAGKYPQFGFAALVSVKDYEAILPADHKALYKHPYYFCLHLFLNQVLNYVENNFLRSSDTKLSFILDDSEEFKDHALKMCRWVKSQWDTKKRMEQLDFKSSEKALPLQCADMLAYRMRKSLDKHLYRDKSTDIKLAIEKLDEELGANGKLIVQGYYGEHLKALVKRHTPLQKP